MPGLQIHGRRNIKIRDVHSRPPYVIQAVPGILLGQGCKTGTAFRFVGPWKSQQCSIFHLTENQIWTLPVTFTCLQKSPVTKGHPGIENIPGFGRIRHFTMLQRFRRNQLTEPVPVRCSGSHSVSCCRKVSREKISCHRIRKFRHGDRSSSFRHNDAVLSGTICRPFSSSMIRYSDPSLSTSDPGCSFSQSGPSGHRMAVCGMIRAANRSDIPFTNPDRFRFFTRNRLLQSANRGESGIYRSPRTETG